MLKKKTTKFISLLIMAETLTSLTACKEQTQSSSLPLLSAGTTSFPVQPIDPYLGITRPLAPYPDIDLTEIETMPVYEIEEYDSSTDAYEATLQSMEDAGLKEAANFNIINGAIEATQEEIEAEKTKLIEFMKNYFSTNSGPYCKDYDTYIIEAEPNRGNSVTITAKMATTTIQEVILDYAYVWDRIIVELCPAHYEFHMHSLSVGTASTENYNKIGEYEIIPFEEAKRIFLSNETDKFIWKKATDKMIKQALEPGKFDDAPIYLTYTFQSIDGKTYARPIYVQPRQLDENSSAYSAFAVIDALKR